jgi:hypothetical protein
MSGILDRMAKRARGEASGVQPRIAPRFAPAAPGARAADLDAKGAHASPSPLAQELNEESWAGFAESESAGSERKGDGSLVLSRRGTEKRRRGGDGEAEDASGAGPAVSSFIEAAHAESGRTAERDQSGRDGEHSLIEERERGRGLDARQEFSRATEGGVRVPRALIMPASDERLETERADAILPRRTKRDLAGAGPEQAALQRREQTAAGIVQRDSRKDPLVREEQEAASREEKTEVHISIGNIELRAPRAEARPQRVPYRPRVTLQDFLHRQEARR